jgi:hypothetical protein
MSFSVSTCITNTGNSPLGPTLSIYSNPVTYLNPGTFVRTVPTTSITGANCPFTFLVPDGTQTIRIFDPVSFCYVDLTVTDNNICDTCDLGLSGVTNNLVSLINVNGLSGSCDNDISDFVIDWYGPSPSNSLAFTSGKGTLFSGQYQYTHPINNVNSPILVDGTYTSRIRKVELNGVKFSSTGGAGNVAACCLTGSSGSVIVSPYNCSNGTGSPDPLYTHYKEFIFDNPAFAASSLNAIFVLSANTKAFAWKFEGFLVYDTIKLTLSGDSYPQPILLEQISIGEDLNLFDFTPTTWPKSADTQTFKKITVLSGLTINNNDKIGINITPNPNNIATSWKFHFGCNSLPTATKTCLDSYKNDTYKIKASTIQILGPDTCGKYKVNYSVSGCSVNETTGFTESTLVKLNTSSSFSNIATDNTTKLLGLDTGYSLYDNFNEITSCGPGRSGVCVSIPGQQIKVVKTATTQVEIYFTSLSDLNVYYTDWSAAQASIVASCGAYSSNSLTYSYYKFIKLAVYNGTPTCGDSTPSYEDLEFHYSSVISSGNTTPYPGFNYYMYITTPLISNNYICPNTCSNCSNQNLANNANATRNLTGYIRDVTGYRRTTPFRDVNGLKSQTSTRTNSSFTGGLTISYTYSNLTYPASGITNTLIPSLSGRTWDWENHTYQSGNNYAQTVFSHNVVVTSWSPLQYKIQAQQISNFNTTGSYIDVWSSTAGILNSNYVYP